MRSLISPERTQLFPKKLPLVINFKNITTDSLAGFCGGGFGSESRRKVGGDKTWNWFLGIKSRSKNLIIMLTSTVPDLGIPVESFLVWSDEPCVKRLESLNEDGQF